jgi:hypothetical protein
MREEPRAAPAEEPAPATAPKSLRASNTARTHFETRRRVDFRETSIDLVLVPGGRLRRFVVLHSKAMQLALGQPHRREIDPLHARQEQFELSTSELWALGIDQARRSLQTLYARVREAKDANTSSPQARPRLPRPLGTRVPPVAANEGALRGELLYAGRTDTAVFGLEVLCDRRVYVIEGLDLARALEVAHVQVGDTILIERAGAHRIAIREECTGSHGESARTLRRGRETFVITKEPSPERRSVGASPNRSARASVGASEHRLGDVA